MTETAKATDTIPLGEMVEVPAQTLEELQRITVDSLNRLRRLEERLDRAGK